VGAMPKICPVEVRFDTEGISDSTACASHEHETVEANENPSTSREGRKPTPRAVLP